MLRKMGKEGEKSMNKNMKNRIITGLMIGTLGAAGLLTGCGANGGAPDAETPRNVAMVLSGHRYFPAVPLNTDAVYSEIYDACYTYGSFSAVVVDGDPFMACSYEISAPDANIDSAKRKQLAEGNAGQILAELSGLQGKTPEADTLTAVQMAASALQSSEESSDKTMIICDSGLSTTGLLDFASKNLIEVPAENIVEQLESIHEIPDLTGIEVVWTGLGQTCGEQDGLNGEYKYKLQSIWEAILYAGGAADVDFDDSPLPSEEPSGDLPECSTVTVIETDLDDTVAELPEVTRWDGESAVQFKGDSAEFVDYAAAAAELEPAAEYLNANPGESVYIFGMTATVVPSSGGVSDIELSQARAAACMEILKAAGVDDSRMTALGLGQRQHSLRVDDTDENGRQIEELAQKNRAVLVVRADSDKVGELLECAGY